MTAQDMSDFREDPRFQHEIQVEEVDFPVKRVLKFAALGTGSCHAWFAFEHEGLLRPVITRTAQPGDIPVASREQWEAAIADRDGALWSQAQQVMGLRAAMMLPVYTVYKQDLNGWLMVADTQKDAYTDDDYKSANDAVRLIEDIVALRRESVRDPLTGVFNRRYFDRQIDAEWRRANRNRLPLAFAIVDVDYFKSYNDSAGHAAGDQVLRRIGGALSERTQRAGDLVCRYGGEEFGVILPNTPLAGALRVMNDLREAVRSMGIANPGQDGNPITISAGVLAVEHIDQVDKLDLDGCMRLADKSLYAAKQQGRDRVIAAHVEQAGF